MPNPQGDKNLLDDCFPLLANYIDSLGLNRGKLTVEEVTQPIVDIWENKPPRVGDNATQEDRRIRKLFAETSHYLALAYFWFSRKTLIDSIKSWPWIDFLRRIPKDTLLVSFNYDSIIERTSIAAGRRIVHVGTSQSIQNNEPTYFGEGPNLLTIKPHGSMDYITFDNAKRSYPLESSRVYAMLPFGATDNIVKLGGVRHAVDITLPGQRYWNWFTDCFGYGQPTPKERRDSLIQHASNNIDKIIIAGFSCSRPDKKEFTEILTSLNTNCRTSVINPNGIPDSLLETLSERFRYAPTLAKNPAKAL